MSGIMYCYFYTLKSGVLWSDEKSSAMLLETPKITKFWRPLVYDHYGRICYEADVCRLSVPQKKYDAADRSQCPKSKSNN